MIEQRRVRPAVAVILPFHGSATEARRAARALGALRLHPGDEAVLADNTEARVAAEVANGAVRVLRCTVPRSVYAARNEAAEATSAPWLLFVDGDCRLPPDLLERYFDPEPAPGVGAVAGEVAGEPGQTGLIPRYIRSRRHLEQQVNMDIGYRPAAVTANLLVRREAFEEIGGFQEYTRSGGDVDLSWRVQAAGWALELNPGASVHHEHRTSVNALLTQARRIGAGNTWLARRHPGYRAGLGPRFFLRAAVGATAWPLLGRPERGLFKALDAAWGAAVDIGMLETNAAPPPVALDASRVIVLESFPRADDPVTAACAAGARAGSLRVEAVRRPHRPAWAPVRSVPTAFWEDDSRGATVRDSLRLLAAGARVPASLAGVGWRLTRAPAGAEVVAAGSLEPVIRRLAQLLGREDLDIRALPTAPVAAAAAIEASG